MSLPITPITSAPVAGVTPGAAKPAPSAAVGFGESLGKMIDSADQSSREANNAVAGMLDGSGDVHTAMIALQRAELSLQLTVQVRNKVVQAYQDIMRMPV